MPGGGFQKSEKKPTSFMDGPKGGEAVVDRAAGTYRNVGTCPPKNVKRDREAGRRLRPSHT